MKPARAFRDGEGEIVAARFVADAEIVAGPAPVRPVRRNAFTTGTKLREQMRELMPKGAIDFPRAMFLQSRIQRDQLLARVGAAGATAQTRIPFHSNLMSDARRARIR
ncbi:MAG: hypothetical protein ABJB69_07140 [Spartobacteria bacterium]